MTTFELSENYLLGNYGRFPLAFSRGEGAWLWDEAGKKYLDFGSGIAVCSLGHSPACLRDALSDQSGKLIHCSNLYHIREQGLLARFIVDRIMERPGKVFFANSGAEVNDAAVKTVRKFFHDEAGGESPDRFEVITCRGSFHGRTLGGIAATGQEKVKTGFAPLLPGFVHVPFNDTEALRAAVSERTAAILFEPVQGEGGIHVATPDFFRTASELRDEHGLLLLLDEVQCGIGRTGDWCGWRTILRDSGVDSEPDIVTWAKGLAGGYPMGAMWVGDRLAKSMGPGTHGSTFGGTPLGSAAALAVLREIEDSGCLERIPDLEQRIRKRCAGWTFPQIRSLRGLGLMLGFELDRSAFPEKEAAPALSLVKRLMEEGLLTVPAGPEVVRWLPPLNVSTEEVDTALDLFEGVLSKM